MSDHARLSVSRLVLAACVAVLGARSAAAQVPVLDGHRYVPSALVTWSFVDTEVSSTSEAGVTSFVVTPDFPTLSALVAVPDRVTGRFISVSQNVSGSVAFGGVLSLNATLGGSGILPRDKSSTLVIGGNGGLRESIGGSLRLINRGPFQFTLRVDFHELQVESVIPDRLPSSPRVSGHVHGVRPAAAAALTLAPSVGLQASISGDWQHFDVITTDDVMTLTGAAAATFSLNPVPLTLLIGGSGSHEFGRELFNTTAEAVFGQKRTQWNVEGGLYFMCRRELDLGLVFTAQVAGGDNNNARHGVFRLGYYF